MSTGTHCGPELETDAEVEACGVDTAARWVLALSHDTAASITAKVVPTPTNRPALTAFAVIKRLPKRHVTASAVGNEDIGGPVR